VNDLLHFSAKPLGRIRSASQYPFPDRKPKGLWVSVGEAWPEWCVAESFGVSRLAHVTRIELASAATILRLTDASDLIAFTDQYGELPEYLRAGTTLAPDYSIAWRKVAADFDGIVIAPYVWSQRHALHWYYGWDVASGCIWNAKAIARKQSIALAPALVTASALCSEVSA
jgi:hypothetical protein